MTSVAMTRTTLDAASRVCRRGFAPRCARSSAFRQDWGVVVVQQVIDAQQLRLGVVTCPAPDAQVRWVATNEMQDPRAFLEGGELLLFTGLDMAGWTSSQWNQYVDRVLQARVSALALAVGITHREVPSALASACRRQGLNLLTVPMETSFVSISQAVAGMLEASDRAAAREAVTMQRRLAQAARRRNPTLSIAQELAKFVNGSVWVMSPQAQVLERAGRTTVGHGAVLDELAVEIAQLSTKGLGSAASWVSHSEHTVLQPVGLRAPVEVYLAVRTPAPLTEYQRTAVLTSLSMLTLEVESRAEVRSTARTLSRRALDLFVEGEERAAVLVLRAAARERPVADLPRTAVIIRAAGEPDRLARVLIALEEGRLPGVVVAALSTDETELHVLVPTDQLDAVGDGLELEGLHVGIGSIAPLDQLGRSMRAAGHALARTSRLQRTVRWADVTGTGVFSIVDETVRDLLADELLDALDRSPIGRQELLRVGTSFLRHHGRINVVGTDLGMHRNTARARVAELERVLNCDFDDPDARLRLWVALQTLASRSA
jgi:purine catabolism regulator